MRERLYEIERALPELLSSSAGWRSLDVDYHPPRVERLYRDVGENRVSLHFIHACEPGAALFHPHPWPSAMRVLSGRYEMAVGAGPGDVPPPVVLTLVADAGLEYEMTHSDGWHWVRPVGGPSLSIMVTGRPWERWSPKSEAPLGPLPPARVDALLALFRPYYPSRA